MKLIALSLVATLALAPAFAATTTTRTPLKPNDYIDLGAGPLMLGASGADIVYEIGDSLPSVVNVGNIQPVGGNPLCYGGSAHVYARVNITGGGAQAIVVSGTGVSCGSGGGTVDVANGSTFYNLLTSSLPAGTNLIGKFGIDQTTDGTTNLVSTKASNGDACQNGTKKTQPINLTASGQIIAGTASKRTYICAINIISATAQNVALVEGTGTVCATNIYGLAGGTTAATGWNFAANGGLTLGNGGYSVVGGDQDANGVAANVCLLSSSTGQISGTAVYAQQ